MIYILEKKKLLGYKIQISQKLLKLLNREEKEYLTCKLNRKI